jgi:hypothetical protein
VLVAQAVNEIAHSFADSGFAAFVFISARLSHLFLSRFIQILTAGPQYCNKFPQIKPSQISPHLLPATLFLLGLGAVILRKRKK